MSIEIPYDFSDVVEQIRPLMSIRRFEDDEQHSPYALAKLLLDMPEFPDFAARFFQDPAIWTDIKAVRVMMGEDNRLPDHENPQKLEMHGFYLDTEPSKSRFFKNLPEAGQTLRKTFQTISIPHKPVRDSRAHPLTAEETQLSSDFLRQNDDLLLAIIGAKYCILTYYNTLDQAIRSGITKNEDFAEYLDPDSHGDYNSYISLLKDNAAGTSSTEELAPILANILRHADNSHDQRSLQRAFHHLFKRSAFATHRPDNANPYRQCPFANSLIKAMQLDLRRTSDGTVFPLGRSYSGVLINFARSEIAAYQECLGNDIDTPKTDQAL